MLTAVNSYERIIRGESFGLSPVSLVYVGNDTVNRTDPRELQTANEENSFVTNVVIDSGGNVTVSTTIGDTPFIPDPAPEPRIVDKLFVDSSPSGMRWRCTKMSQENG